MMFRSYVGRWRLIVAFVLSLVPASVHADTVTLAWDPSTGATGYTVKWGTAQGSYPNSANAGNNTTFDIPNLAPGATYWAVVQAYDATQVSPLSTPLQFTVPMAPVPCTYSISPATANVGAGASGGTVTVTTQAGCAWSATSSSAFLAFQNGTGRTGPGTVSFTLTANTTTSSRIGTGTIAGQGFAVTQAGQVCTYSISPASASVGATAASGTINVTTQAGCAWSATSASSFLTFTNGTGRSGPGSVGFSVAANTATTPRTGTATVAGQSFSVSQAAAPQSCTYAITPMSANAPAAGTSGTITVTTQEGCAWSASSLNGFLTFPDGADRTGPGTVTFEVAANTSGFRTATANVAGRLFTVAQMGGSCTYSITPASVNTSAAATSGSVTVTTQAGCSWSATSMTGFLAFQNAIGRTGPGTVSFTIAENTSTGSRNAVGAIGGVTFMVAQSGATPAGSTPAEPSPWGTDFDGDGKNDVLIHDPVAGTIEAWFLENAAIKGTQTLSHSLEENWRLAGRGDFNADGKPDLVMQHMNDGWVSIWFMDGTTRIEADPTSIAQTDPHWKVVGVGDFNGDGKPDIAWQHSDNGKLAVWEMDGVTVTATTSITPDGVPDLSWKVVGVGDFNNDGRSDLVWRHMGTGDVGVWLMNGLSRIIHSPLSPFSVPDQRWQVGAVIDVNGDGKPDLIWTHTDGTIMIWHMNGTIRTTYPIIPALLPSGWQFGPR